MIKLAANVPPIVPPVISGYAGRTQADTPGLFAKFVSGIIGLLLIGATIWSFFQLILGGFDWISSGGDKGKLEAAQKRITNAIIGLIFVFASWAIFLFILRFLGVIPADGGTGIKFQLPSLF